MTPTLPEIGAALYGPRWQREVAKALGVNERTVRRWVAGDTVPPGVYAELGELCRERAELLRKLAERVN